MLPLVENNKPLICWTKGLGRTHRAGSNNRKANSCFGFRRRIWCTTLATTSCCFGVPPLRKKKAKESAGERPCPAEVERFRKTNIRKKRWSVCFRKTQKLAKTSTKTSTTIETAPSGTSRTFRNPLGQWPSCPSHPLEPGGKLSVQPRRLHGVPV